MQLPIRGAGFASVSSVRAGRWRRPLAALTAVALGVGLLGASMPTAQAAIAGTFCAQPGDEPLDYAPVSDVEAFNGSETVTGLTVSKGTEPGGFTGKYVGYIADALGKGKDMLLFKLSSPVIDGTDPSLGLKPAGIWAGMSGSPVYDTDHRLIGAVAYSLNSDNLPIAGVTPAEYMKAIGTTAVGTSSKVRVTGSNLKVTPAGARAAGISLVGSTFSPVRAVKVAGDAGTKENAFINRTLARTPRTARAASFARSGNFLPAGAMAPAAVSDPLKAGGNIAVLYANGDLVAGGVGTVTATCGNTVWAFGHPMDYLGNVSLQMSNASVAMVVPDSTGWYGSYKQVSTYGDPVGVITQDRRMGIRGTLGATDPDDFPITLTVKNAAGVTVDTYQTLLADPELGASAVAALAGRAAYEQLDQYGAGTGQIDWTISFTREGSTTPETLSNTQVVASSDFPDEIATPPADQLWALSQNEFEDVTITGVAVTLKLLSADALTYKATGIQLESPTPGVWGSLSGSKLKPGSTHNVRAQYSVKKNGRANGTAYGDPIALTLKSTAKTSGTFKIAAASTYDGTCEVDDSGEIVCAEWSEDGPKYADLDELLAALSAEKPYNTVVGALKYKLKKGSASAKFSWLAPSMVTGSAKASFSIKP